MESLHTNKKSVCPTCHKQISMRNFASHLQMHLSAEERTTFKCSVGLCRKMYYFKNGLNKHIKNLHSSIPRKKFKCELCSKEYYQKSHLQQHVRSIHLGSVSKYVCTLCNAEFKTKSGRDYHVVVTHTGEKAFTCEKCPAKFPSAHQLKSHHAVHSDEKPHKCSISFRQFKRKNELAIHIKNVHSQSTKDFGRPTCHKTFYTKSDLNMHNKTHAMGGDFACYFCKKEFIQLGNLDSHLRTHTQEKPYFCPHKSCKYSFANFSSVRSHKRTHHPSTGDQATPSKIWSCYFCPITHFQLEHLVVHMRSHTLEEPFPCNLCKKAFRSEFVLKSHISTHTKEKPFSCTHCGKCFSQSGTLKSHIATHTGEKGFFCFCGFSAIQKNTLKVHLRRRHLQTQD